MSTSASSPRPSEGVGFETSIWRLLARHRLAALFVAVVCVVMVAMLAFAAFGAKGGAVSDATTCDQWGSANQARQQAYARLYIREHGRVSARWGPPLTGVINAINAGCSEAFGEDVSESATVVQAISRSF